VNLFTDGIKRLKSLFPGNIDELLVFFIAFLQLFNSNLKNSYSDDERDSYGNIALFFVILAVLLLAGTDSFEQPRLDSGVKTNVDPESSPE
jgi:hypothetical protein